MATEGVGRPRPLSLPPAEAAAPAAAAPGPAPGPAASPQRPTDSGLLSKAGQAAAARPDAVAGLVRGSQAAAVGAAGLGAAVSRLKAKAPPPGGTTTTRAKLAARQTPAGSAAVGKAQRLEKQVKAKDAYIQASQAHVAKAEAANAPGMQAFQAQQRQERVALAKALRADPEVQRGLKSFDKLSVKEKVALGTRISKLQGQVQHFTPAPISVASNQVMKGSEGGFDASETKGELGKIQLNSGSTTMKDPQEFVDTIVHEQTHRFQQELVDSKLTASDGPRGAAAAVYRANDDAHYNEAPGDELKQQNPAAYERQYKAYHDQPQERDAFRAGEHVHALVFAPEEPR